MRFGKYSVCRSSFSCRGSGGSEAQRYWRSRLCLMWEISTSDNALRLLLLLLGNSFVFKRWPTNDDDDNPRCYMFPPMTPPASQIAVTAFWCPGLSVLCPSGSDCTKALHEITMEIQMDQNPMTPLWFTISLPTFDLRSTDGRDLTSREIPIEDRLFEADFSLSLLLPRDWKTWPHWSGRVLYFLFVCCLCYCCPISKERISCPMMLRAFVPQSIFISCLLRVIFGIRLPSIVVYYNLHLRVSLPRHYPYGWRCRGRRKWQAIKTRTQWEDDDYCVVELILPPCADNILIVLPYIASPAAPTKTHHQNSSLYAPPS